MDFIYRLFIFILPFLLVVAAYIWLTRKVFAEKKTFYKILALLFIAAGCVYTVRAFILDMQADKEDFPFNFMVLIVNTFIMFAASIILAIARPEK